MKLIVQPGFLAGMNLENYDEIVVMHSEKDVVPVEVMKSLIAKDGVTFTQVPEKADDITLGIVIGKTIGDGTYTDTCVLVQSEKLRKAVSALGISTAAVTKKRTTKTAAAKSAASTAKEKAETTKEAAKKITGEEAPKRTRTRAPKAPVAEPVKENVKKTAEEKPAVKKEKPVSSGGDKFNKILAECGVSETMFDRVRKAVKDSGEILSYEMRLRFNIPQPSDAKVIFNQTKEKYPELKKIADSDY